MKTNELDKELIGYMESLEKDNSLSYLEKMQKVIDWKKDHMGLIGLHISLGPSEKNISNEEIAKEMFKTTFNSAEGKLEDGNEEVLNEEY